MSVDSSASSTAGTMRLKRLIKPPAKPVVLDLRDDYENCQINKEYIVNSRKMCYNIYAYYTYKEKRYE